MRTRATLIALSLTLIAPAAANAVPLNGSPLNVHVGPQGQLQAFRTGEPAGIFYNPELIDGDAGFFLALTAGAAGDRLRLRGRCRSRGARGLHAGRGAGLGDRLGRRQAIR